MPKVERPVALRVKFVPEQTLDTEAVAVPALGVPEQGGWGSTVKLQLLQPTAAPAAFLGTTRQKYVVLYARAPVAHVVPAWLLLTSVVAGLLVPKYTS